MTITVVGLGCGDIKLLTPEASEALERASVVFIMKNYRRLLPDCRNVVVMENLHQGIELIRSEAARRGDVAVGVTGDPGIFSFLPLLQSAFVETPGMKFTVIPGISSLNYFFARLKTAWSDAKIVSGHGRELSEGRLMQAVISHRKTVVFCDSTRNPAWVLNVLRRFSRDFLDGGEPPLRVAVGVNLSLDDERIVTGSVTDISDDQLGSAGHALVAVFNDSAAPRTSLRPRDSDFIRAEVPMTRQEVRSVVIDELRPGGDSVVWDIGAGTGSVAVSCSLLCPNGEVHAVERLPEAVKLIYQNRKKFKAVNLEVHEGSAPEILASLPKPTHVFIGGSGGNLPEILDYIAALGSGIRVCVSSVTLESGAGVSAALLNAGAFCGVSVVNLAITRSRPLGGVSLMAAQNPVTLWIATTGSGGEA